MSESRPPRKPRFASMYPYLERFESHHRLPQTGRDRDAVLAELAAMAAEEDRLADSGRLSGSVYSGDHEHYEFLTRAFGLFAHANVLQRDMYPSATKLEAEIVAMTASMMHGEAVAGHHPGEEVCGTVTFGGTESLINPLLVYRERGRAERSITEPEVIIPVTAHVALDKAAHYFGIRLLKAPLTADYVVDVDWVADHVNDNTVALVGSAGDYAHGLIDPIASLSEIAAEHDIGLHVDGCLGGFILPWGERLGYPIPPFDFRLPGVTSISADTHKFGYALKGTSVLLYRNRDLRAYQYFISGDWPGGIYFSPGLSGSRSGGIVAQTWAAMVTLGEEGYLRIADGIFSTGKQIREGIAAMPDLQVLGDPSFLIAFGSDTLDIFHVNDHLSACGWRLNGLQYPPAVHFCVTRPNTAPGIAEAFLADLADGVEYARNPARPTPKSGALYGLGATPEGLTRVREILETVLDAMYEVPDPPGTA